MYKFSDYLESKGYSQEQQILSTLPGLDPIQQVKMDISLHKDAIANNSFGSQSILLAKDAEWKNKLIEILQGTERNPELVKKTIDIINRDIESHKRPALPNTGSEIWHSTWISVYEQWLNILHQILRSVNGTQTRAG